MDDSKVDPTPTQLTQTIADRQGIITVVVNLQLPPWPEITPPAPPQPVAFPAPPAPVDDLEPIPAPSPDPLPVTPAPVVKQNWVNRWLGHVWLGLADDAKRFYKKMHFWMFAIISAAPDLYNAAVDNHILPGGHVPPPLEKFFNIIGFLGVASTLVKAKQKIQSSS